MKKKSTARPSLLQTIRTALEDLKGQNIVTLDVTRLTDVTDYLVIATGNSNRQVRALAEQAMEECKKNGMPAMGVEGLDAGEWVLVDFGDAVLHVMQPETREFYDLERLWQAAETTVATPAKTPAAKTPAAKPARTRTGGGKKTAQSEAISAPEVVTQGAAAKARKAPARPKTAGGSKAAGKTTPAKAGVYAKTGTRKPAASKTGTAPKKTATAAKKPAAAKPAGKSAGKTASSKPAPRKPRPA